MKDKLKSEDIGELAACRKSININIVNDESLTTGERMADKLAAFAGSWKFLSIFAGVLFIWIAINSVQLLFMPFDPYPYILLNLVLSCISAIQAPVIMMSQNRQDKKDRIRAEHDYEINLKTEILIEELINKLTRLEQRQEEVLAHLANPPASRVDNT